MNNNIAENKIKIKKTLETKKNITPPEKTGWVLLRDNPVDTPNPLGEHKK